MSREIDHIAGETGPQNSAHQIGGGCTLCFAFIPLIIGFMGTRDACSEPLSLYLIVTGLLQVLLVVCRVYPRVIHNLHMVELAVPFKVSMVWSILGIFGHLEQVLHYVLHVLLHFMIFAWMTVIGILCMCCCMVFMAGAMAGQMEKDKGGSFGEGLSGANAV